MCGVRESSMYPCRRFNGNDFAKVFVSGWMRKHVKEDENNLRNTVMFKFCMMCETKNTIVTQPECDIYYEKRMTTIINEVKNSYLGVVHVRNFFMHGLIRLN